ncbi:hypothetical protein LCGC14_2098910, partial [marine sediment metagenome]
MLQDSNLLAPLSTLNKVGQKFKKGYSYPSQSTILRHIETFYNEVFSIRTLNRRLRRLEDLGYIVRQRRTKTLPGGLKSFTSTMYTL